MMKQEEIIQKMLDRVAAIEPPIPVVFPKPKITHAKGDEEEMVLLFSDLQIGHKTKSYNKDVFVRRLNNLYGRVCRIAELHRKAYPIKKLNVLMLGDMVQSDLLKRFVDLDELESPVIDQFINVCVPNVSGFLISLTRNFELVKVYCVYGNHGAVHKYASERTNWDYLIYKFLEKMLEQQPRIKFDISDDFYKVVNILGWKFLMVHGDMIPSYFSIPFYGVTNRAMRWQGSLPERFNYVVLGHFHTATSLSWNDVEIFINGCFVTDDSYVLKRLGFSSQCVQLCFGVHPRKGITWRYRLNLETGNKKIRKGGK